MTVIDTFAPSPARFTTDGLLAVLRTRWRRRQQRLAVASLLEMNASRLDDLGISVGDVHDALRTRDAAGAHLRQRRASRSAAWGAVSDQ